MGSVPFIRADVSSSDDPMGGFAVVLYVAGCPRSCPGCQNPQLQSAASYQLVSVSDVIEQCRGVVLKSGSLVDSVAFSGGDWMLYPDEYVDIAQWVLSQGRQTVLYTGELFESLSECVKRVSGWVIDGPYDERKPAVFPASSNQRVFHNGTLVDPVTLPLYKHLLDIQSLSSVKQGGDV